MSQSMSDEDQEILACTPFAVLGLVAGADGKIDRKEVDRFRQMLDLAAESPAPLLAETMTRASANCEELLGRVADGAMDCEGVLTAGAKLLDARQSSDQSVEFKRGLVLMGIRIAEASGGGLFGMGERTDEDEQATIDRIRTLLGA